MGQQCTIEIQNKNGVWFKVGTTSASNQLRKVAMENALKNRADAVKVRLIDTKTKQLVDIAFKQEIMKYIKEITEAFERLEFSPRPG